MYVISNMEAAILGLLYEHHHYVHRIEEIIEKRSMRSWADLESSSIDVLKRLEENDLIKSEIREVGDEHPEKVYFITDEVNWSFWKKLGGFYRKKVELSIHLIWQLQI